MLMIDDAAADQKWQQLVDRVSTADGRFFYGVTSTGIYCRPGCKSRRPRRENVRFFDLPEQAEQAGFRPCKRCRPNETVPVDENLARVQKACRYIAQAVARGAEDRPSLTKLAAHVGASPHHFQRRFKQVMGISPAEYAESCRLSRLKAGLRQEGAVTGAIYDAGYGASSRVYEKAAGELGMSPKIYAKGAKGIKVAYAITDSPLGRLFVAATDKGVCFLSLGEADETLLGECRSDLPGAVLTRDEKTLEPWLKEVVAYLEGRIPHPDLPVDLRGTAFQRRVWAELMKIPAGITRTYTELAEDLLDNPGARRAVARACATNPVSLIVPCHRVQRGDGGLGGYRWGLGRKQALLDLEQKGRGKG